MRELPTEFVGKGEVKGFHFRQLDKTEKGYLYEVVTESGTHYEVFERRVNELYGTVTYPSSKAFGIWAYCIGKLDKAKQRLSDIDNAAKVGRKRLHVE